MSQFDSILNELRTLKAALQKRADRLWAIRHAVTAAYGTGHQATDFLPRRLALLKDEEELQFSQLIDQLKKILNSKLTSHLIPLNSSDDIKTIQRIRKTIRYIRNAFAGELPLSSTIHRITQTLPAALKN